MPHANLSNFDSYQGKTLMLAQTQRRGVVRLLQATKNWKREYVTHEHVHTSGEGCCGHYFDDLDEALKDFNERVSKGKLAQEEVTA